MAEKAASDNLIVIDRSFYVPPNMEGFIYEDELDDTDSDDDFETDELINEAEGNLEYGDELDTDPNALYPPSFTIGDQVVRIAPDGTSLVDVTLNVEDVFGATNYDIRLTKG